MLFCKCISFHTAIVVPITNPTDKSKLCIDCTNKKGELESKFYKILKINIDLKTSDYYIKTEFQGF